MTHINKTNQRKTHSVPAAQLKPVAKKALQNVVGGIMWCRVCGGICRE